MTTDTIPTIESIIAHAEQIAGSAQGAMFTWQQELVLLAAEVKRLRAELNAHKVVMAHR